MARMQWDNATQCYVITDNNQGPVYKISIPSIKERFAYGNIKLNINFKEHKLINTNPQNVYINPTLTTQSNALDFRIYSPSFNDTYTISDSDNDGGLLIDTNKTYIRNFNFSDIRTLYLNAEVNRLGSYGTSVASYQCKADLNYLYYYTILYGTFRASMGGTSVTISTGGAVYKKKFSNTWYWVYKKNNSDSEHTFPYNSTETPVIYPESGKGFEILEFKVG